jgi:hypothetical protein
MLDKAERQFVPGQDVASVINTLQSSLYGVGITLAQTGPNQWTGRGQTATYSIVPKIMVSTAAAQGGYFLDVRIAADFEGNGLVLFVLAWFFFFPIAIVLAIMAYQDWQNRQNHLSQVIWSPLASRLGPPPAAPWGTPTPGGFQPPRGY